MYLLSSHCSRQTSFSREKSVLRTLSSIGGGKDTSKYINAIQLYIYIENIHFNSILSFKLK